MTAIPSDSMMSASTSSKGMRVLKTGLRIAPWVMFGPITGILSERALRCYRRGEKVLAGMYVVLNVSILVTIPLVTAAIASTINLPHA